MLKELFSEDQFKSLWQVFKLKRERQGQDAVAKWDELSNLKTRVGVVAAKRCCLEVALLGGSDQSW